MKSEAKVHVKNHETKEDKHIRKMILDAVYKQVAEDMILNGEYDVEKMTPQEIRDVILDKMDFLAKTKNVELSIVVDHTEDLLKRARLHKKENQIELASLFYATFFEHTINDLILRSIKKRKFSEATLKRILQLNFEDKATWILEILNIPVFNKVHLDRIKEIAKIRNGYIHYKWIETDEKEDDKRKIILSDAEKTAKYIQKYKEKVLFQNARRKAINSLGSTFS